MKKNIIRKADGYASQHRHRRIWRKVVGGLACVVVFCTIYALIMPAITMEKTRCGIPEHTHTEDCYTQVTTVTKKKPICTLESLNLHKHTEGCFDENGEPVCGYSDFVVHEHDSSCYDEDGKLWCPLSEIKAHTHNSGCYAAAKPVHTHTEDCYTQERGELICTEEEREGHTHSVEAGCFNEDGTLICQAEEEPGHRHTDDCYSWEQVLSCGLTDTETAGEPELVCGKEEIILHEHSSGCFDKNNHLICGKQQVLEHVHDQACFQTVEEPADTEALTCRLEENKEHQHGPLCYGTWELTCGLEEHTHTEECNIPAELTEEEQAQVDEVIALIDALPKMEEIQKTLAAYDEEKDYDGYNGYLTEMQSQVSDVYAAYMALTDAQQEAVTNVKQLLAMMNGLELNEMVVMDDSEIPQKILSEIAREYDIYPGTKQAPNESGPEVWVAMNNENADKATVKATVTLPAGTTAAENSYLYIREVKEEENSAYYPTVDTVKNAVGEYNDYQCYAIHWVQIYQYDEQTFDNNTYTVTNDKITSNSGNTEVGKLYKDGDGNQWVCIYGTKSALSDAKALIQIEYLHESAYLIGERAHRKLRIFNSRAADGQTLEENATATGVTANTGAYTGFTFETNRGGPYVFVSQNVFEGYVSNLTISTMLDGTEPFDSNSNPGNDEANNNEIVRSYDVIQYNLTATLAARQAGVTREDATLYLEMTMDADLTQASFDVSQMLWMNGYTIYYLNEAGKVLYWQDAEAYNKGKYYYLGSSADAPTSMDVSDIEKGVSSKSSASLNAILSHSTNGTSSYTSQVATQRLVGYAAMKAGSTSADHNVLAAQETLSAAIQVLNAKNNTSFQPIFRAWLKGNETNYGSESGDGNSVQLSPVVKDNRVTSKAVNVSATAKFNLELAKNSNVTYRGWFDSAKGVEVTETGTEKYTINGKIVTGAQLYKLLETLAKLDENAGKANPENFTDKNGMCSANLAELSLGDYKEVFSHIRYGRITGYGLTLQVYNSAATTNGAAAKGFKGITLPQGDITFALDLAASIKKVDPTSVVDETQYYAQLWEYSENKNVRTNYDYTYDDPHIGRVNINGTGKGNQSRNMYWANLDSTCYAAWSATYNGLYAGKGDTVHSDYYGGKWMLDNDTGDGCSFTVSNYDFNFTSTGALFPTIKAGNSGVTTGYNTYIGCFSSGQIQVLNVFPRRQTATVNMSTAVTAKNLTLNTTDGAAFRPFDGDSTGYAQETNINDNQVNDAIPLYAPGRMTKGNAFCKRSFFDNRDTANLANSSYFLGTDFWNTGYDCSAFAGQDITLVGAARIDAGDYAIRSMNLLQLFDTKALSLDLENATPYVVSKVANAVSGDTTILYAADPDYPAGYDTNDKSVLDYMSTVREEDLIYYKSLADLETANYTCVGVLAELRSWTIYGEGGYSTVLKIPMKVSEEGNHVGKTVATVNAVRIWTNPDDMKDISWADGVYDGSKGKNSVAGYVTVDFGSIDHYSGQVANGSPYAKTEYVNGQVILGTNTGGYVYGSSLLILGYKAEVGINVDKEAAVGATHPTYDLDKGQYMVNYRLNDIIARPVDIGKSQDTETALTVTAKLDESYTSASGYTSDKQRIAVSNGTYQMVPSTNVKLYKDGTDETLDSVEISKDAQNPTTVNYRLFDDKGKETGRYTIQIYAERDTNGTEVVFHLANVTVGAGVPEITFGAEINPIMANNNDTITASAYVTGTSDIRAYSEVNGNMDSTTIGIIQLGSTRLVKSVDTRYIELNGTINYTVTYTNSGSGALNTLYLNDLLPDNNDNRGSKYDGALELTGVKAYLSGSSEFSAGVKFYYSTEPYAELREAVDLGNADNRNSEKIEQVLKKYFHLLGTIESGDSEVTYSDTFKKMSEEEKAKITGIYAVVNGLTGGNSINLVLETKSLNNQAGNGYQNIAYSWLAGSDSVELVSNQVETAVLSRTISGVVWYDKNLNGIRDDDELRLEGVECTLFKKNETTGKYEMCTKDVTGGEIGSYTTGRNGAYCFDKLAAGDYIVAFSGEVLNQYTGLTTYQVTNGGAAVNSDAVAISQLKADGIDIEGYVYAIKYSNDAPQVGLHTIEKIVEGNLPLTNSVEQYANLDCGVIVAGPELPMTGGSGTTPYTIGGLLLTGAGLLLLYKDKKRRKEDFASS